MPSEMADRRPASINGVRTSGRATATAIKAGDRNFDRNWAMLSGGGGLELSVPRWASRRPPPADTFRSYVLIVW